MTTRCIISYILHRIPRRSIRVTSHYYYKKINTILLPIRRSLSIGLPNVKLVKQQCCYQIRTTTTTTVVPMTKLFSLTVFNNNDVTWMKKFTLKNKYDRYYMSTQSHPNNNSNSSISSNNSSSTTTTNSNTNRNIDIYEVEKFSNMSHQWWDIQHNPLIHMNPIRIQFIQECIQQYYLNNQNNNNTNLQSSSMNSTTTTTTTTDTTGTIITTTKQPQQQPSSSSSLSSLRILDVGCGGGLLSESLVRVCTTPKNTNDDNNTTNTNTVIGIDVSKSLIDIAQYHAQQTISKELVSNLQYINISVDDYITMLSKSSQNPTITTTVTSNTDITTTATNNNNNNTPNTTTIHIDPTNQFDIICCLEVLEHIPNYQLILHSLCQYLLKDNGLLILSTISPTIQSYIITILGAEYITRHVPMGTHNFHQYISPQMIQNDLLQLSLLSSSSSSSTVPINMVPSLNDINSSNNNNIDNRIKMEMIPRRVTGMVIPLSSIPSILLFNQWDWQLDPNNTNINWIGCYQKQQQL